MLIVIILLPNHPSSDRKKIHKVSRRYKFRNQDKLYFVTLTVIHWLDVFIRKEYRDIFLETIRYCQKNKGLEVCAYVVMSSHIHMIIGRNSGPSLEGIIRDIKKYTSIKITEAIKANSEESRKELFLWLFRKAGALNSNNVKMQFWQQHNHPVELATNEMIDQRLDYIHDNPVKAGVVLSQEAYLYSSAINYAGLPEKLLEIILI
ncbi:MAG: transposase [Chryseolinea sp.]